jgi:lipoprotein-anchoring transpeptidase ErfK/SrfK
MKKTDTDKPAKLDAEPNNSLVVLEYEADTPAEAAKYGRFHKFTHHINFLLVFVLLALICGDIYGLLNYQSHPVNRHITQTISGVALVNKDKSDAAQILADAAKSQKVYITINGETYSYNAVDLGIKRDFSAVLDAAYPPPDNLMSKLTAKNEPPILKTYVEKKRMVPTIESKLGNYKTSVDATVRNDNGTLVVNPSKEGVALDFDQIAHQIEQSDLRANWKFAADLKIRPPAILTAAADTAKVQAEALIKPAYGITADSGETKFASVAQKATWLNFKPDPAKHSIDVTLDSGAAQSTMNNIAQTYSQPAITKLTLTATDGSYSVLDEGQPGIAVDQTSINSELTKFGTAIASNQPYTITIKLAVQPQGQRNLGTTTGGKFVLVDKAQYKAWAINNTTAERSMVVSTGRPGLETPSGHFTILRKTKLTNMSGCNSLAGCWSVANVPNAQFFTSEGHALHGTYWYINWGHENHSHGCVNLQLADAAWLYDWTTVGTPVVVV